ncbi:MAG: glycosyltransferase [Planctomycetota bacterium]
MIVAHIIPGLDPKDGGPPVALEGLSIAQVACGAEVRVVSTFREGDDDARVRRMREQGVATEWVGPVKTRFQFAPGMNEAVDRAVAGADVVHIHSLWEQVQHVAAKAARRHRVPYVFRPCGMLDPWSLSQSRLKKRVVLGLRLRRDLNGAAALHYTADAEAAGAEPLGLKPPAVVVSNGVQTAPFRDAPDDPGFLDRRCPRFAGRPIVIFLSRLHPKKGGDLLIRAFAACLERAAPDRRPALVFVGPDDGKTQAEWQALAEALKVADDLAFLGLLNGDDKVHALRAADVFCLPSHQENFGIAVVEALAAGTPAVVSDQVNIHDAIAGSGFGASVPMDVPAIADALHAWLNDADRRAATRRDALGWVEATYGWPAIAKRWVDVEYPRLIGRPSGAVPRSR